LKLGPALTLSQNPIFEMASNVPPLSEQRGLKIPLKAGIRRLGLAHRVKISMKYSGWGADKYYAVDETV
jgi:hypothetical protein